MREHRIFASLCDRLLAPLERNVLGPRRAKLLSEVNGDVLDVGSGTGVNLGYFRVATKVVAVEPDAAMRRILQRKAAAARVPVEICDSAAESLPFADGSFDTVVFTLALCSVGDPDLALAEAHRVLRPNGELIVLEHVRGGERLARWQDRLTPVNQWLAAGCHLNRDTSAAVERAGFRFDSVERFAAMPGWIPISPMLQAVASRED